MAIFDITPALPLILKHERCKSEDIFCSQWEMKNWRNVPGPVYTGITDTCLIGRLEAPENVLYDENGQEFLFRQPGSLAQLRQVVCAASIDPFTGYACDGNEHWTAALIREWWSRRHDLLTWIAEQLRGKDLQTHSDLVEQNQERGLRDFEEYVQSGLQNYLRAYVFFLEKGRKPQHRDYLPEI
jgi:hypothetical protein